MTETKEIDGAEGQRAVRAVPPSRFSRLIRNELAWALVIFVLVTVWTWFRVSYADQDVVWAEDGNIFLKEQIEFGTWGTLFMPYAGYQHFLPRVFAAGIVELIPLEHYNRAVFAACAIFAGLVGAARIIDRGGQSHVADIKEKQDQFGRQARIPHPPGAPHRLAPQGAGPQ